MMTLPEHSGVHEYQTSGPGPLRPLPQVETGLRAVPVAFVVQPLYSPWPVIRPGASQVSLPLNSPGAVNA